MPLEQRLYCVDAYLTPVLGVQAIELNRIAATYRLIYNHLLTKWLNKTQPEPTEYAGSAALRYCKHALKNLLSFTEWVEEGEIGLAYCALSEVVRNITESIEHDLPYPTLQAEGQERVVFYKGYDVKTQKRWVELPIVGGFQTSRFRYFAGAIRAVGVRRQGNGWVCEVFYKKNLLAKPLPLGEYVSLEASTAFTAAPLHVDSPFPLAV